MEVTYNKFLLEQRSIVTSSLDTGPPIALRFPFSHGFIRSPTQLAIPIMLYMGQYTRDTTQDVSNPFLNGTGTASFRIKDAVPVPPKSSPIKIRDTFFTSHYLQSKCGNHNRLLQFQVDVHCASVLQH